MAFSYSQHTGDGTTRAFTFSFAGQDEGYIREDDVVALVDGVEIVFTLTSSNTLEFQNAPAEGSKIIIRRVMPKEHPYSDFRRGNNFGQENVNNSFLQLLYVVHEILDGYFPNGYSIQDVVDFLGGITVQGDANVSGRLISNGIQANGTINEVYVNEADGTSAVSLAYADEHYINASGDAMRGNLETRGYKIRIDDAVEKFHPATKRQLDNTSDAFSAQVASLQGQFSEAEPLEASAFSEISWHGQTIENSVNVPEGKNAWSFGPRVTVANGVNVTVPAGSFWTVADGEAIDSEEISTLTVNSPLVNNGTSNDVDLALQASSPTDNGYMSSSDKSKLDGIESGATADMTAIEIKNAYESNSDTNAFTDSLLNKLDGIESGATADQTATEIKTLYESNSDTNVFTNAEKSKLGGIESGATADQTASEIKTAYESNTDTNAFTDSYKLKLDNIEDNATADQTASEIKTLYESNSNTNAFTDTEQSKLAGIESNATRDQTASEIKTAYESNSNTNAFTDYAAARINDLVTATNWTSASLQNGWSNFGSGYQSARYRRNAAGAVYVEGLVSGGPISPGTTVLTLPAGLRPASDIKVVTVDANGPVHLNVEDTGAITCQSVTTNAWLSITLTFQIA